MLSDLLMLLSKDGSSGSSHNCTANITITTSQLLAYMFHSQTHAQSLSLTHTVLSP